MNENKCIVRYVGHRTLLDGARGFDFSFGRAGAALTLITVEAPVGLFYGQEHIPIQEGAGICYETLKSRIESDPGRHHLDQHAHYARWRVELEKEVSRISLSGVCFDGIIASVVWPVIRYRRVCKSRERFAQSAKEDPWRLFGRSSALQA